MDSRIRKIHEQLKSGRITSKELIKSKLDLLRANTHNTVNYLLEDLAVKLAEKVDEKLSRGEEIGLLEGIPFGVKDVFLIKGEYASASSRMLKDYVSPYTATAVSRLMDAGAIPVVKENCDCFGHGSTSENSVFGPVKNARNPELVAGGSSGGSAVNVALGYTIFSIGGDTGGSVRQPAGYNGIYGIKPTYGRVSRYGLMAYASSTDCVGALAATPEDIRIVLNAISGRDFYDPTTFESEPVSEGSVVEYYDFAGTEIGYYKSFIENDALDPEIRTQFYDLIEKLKNKGIKVRELDFYDGRLLVSAYYTIAMAETASNLARLDGTNYGARREGKNLKEGYQITRSENFTQETQRRIVGGNQVLSHGYSESVYLRANQIRRKIEESFEKELSAVSLIISPVSPVRIPKIGDTLNDPLAMYLSDAYTVGFSLGGLPVLTTPVALESGLQITAAKRGEELILKFANYLNTILK
jgi:aspartyl-tRNA(Asn)/glutamyl-tRNA(Gln) amidotransferase subunit A